MKATQNVQRVSFSQSWPAEPNLLTKTPQVGFEPTTNRLTVDRSTTELLRNGNYIVHKLGLLWQVFFRGFLTEKLL